MTPIFRSSAVNPQFIRTTAEAPSATAAAVPFIGTATAVRCGGRAATTINIFRSPQQVNA